MVKDRQRKGCLSDEHIARHRHEGRTGGIGPTLVVAGNNDTCSLALNRNLRRTQNMTCRMKADGNAVQRDGFPKIDRLRRPGKVRAVAQRHDVKRLPRGQRFIMTGTGMVGMAMSNQRPRHRSHRIDIEIADRTIETGRSGIKQGLGLDHDAKIGREVQEV